MSSNTVTAIRKIANNNHTVFYYMLHTGRYQDHSVNLRRHLIEIASYRASKMAQEVKAIAAKPN